MSQNKETQVLNTSTVSYSDLDGTVCTSIYLATLPVASLLAPGGPSPHLRTTSLTCTTMLRRKQQTIFNMWQYHEICYQFFASMKQTHLGPR